MSVEPEFLLKTRDIVDEETINYSFMLENMEVDLIDPCMENSSTNESSRY